MTSYDKRTFHPADQTKSRCQRVRHLGLPTRGRLYLVPLLYSDLFAPVSRIMASSTSTISVFVVTADVRSERRIDLHTTVGQLKVRAALPRSCSPYISHLFLAILKYGSNLGLNRKN